MCLFFRLALSSNITNTGTGYTDFVDDRLTTMTAVAVAGTTIVSVATTEGINPGSFVSIAQTTLGSPSTQIGIITNVSVTSVGNGKRTQFFSNNHKTWSK